MLETAAASVDQHRDGEHAELRTCNTANNTATDATAVVFPNLSTSTKTRGRSQRRRSAARRHAALHDHADRIRGLPDARACRSPITSRRTSTFAAFVSIPAGATSAFTPAPGGRQQQGHRSPCPASPCRRAARVTVVFDVTVDNVTPGRAHQQPRPRSTIPTGRMPRRPRRPCRCSPSLMPSPGRPSSSTCWSSVSPSACRARSPRGTHTSRRHQRQQPVADLHDERAAADRAHAEQRQLHRDAC